MYLPSQPRNPYEAIPEAKTYGEAAQAAWEGSATGFMVRQLVTGEASLPSYRISEMTPFFPARLAAVVGLGSDLPLMIGTGAVATPLSSPLGGAFAVGAVPAAIRQAYMDKLTTGSFHPAEEAWEATKAGLSFMAMHKAGEMIGANQLIAAGIDKATAQKVADGTLRNMIGDRAAKLIADGVAKNEATSMATASAYNDLGINAAQSAIIAGVQNNTANIVKSISGQIGAGVGATSVLEWRLPHPEEFIDMSVAMFGLKFAGRGAEKLRQIYMRYGKTPGEVAKDMAARPSILTDIFDQPMEKKESEGQFLRDFERALDINDRAISGEMLSGNDRLVIERANKMPEDTSPVLVRALEIAIKREKTPEEVRFLEAVRSGSYGEMYKGVASPETVRVEAERKAHEMEVAAAEQRMAAKQPTPEQQAKLDEAQKRHDNVVAFTKSQYQGNEVELHARLRNAARALAAERREILGEMTTKEMQAREATSKANYVGREVIVDGENAVVTGTKINKVNVRYEDGREETVTRDKVKPRKTEVPKMTVGMTPEQEAEYNFLKSNLDTGNMKAIAGRYGFKLTSDPKGEVPAYVTQTTAYRTMLRDAEHAMKVRADLNPGEVADTVLAQYIKYEALAARFTEAGFPTTVDELFARFPTRYVPHELGEGKLVQEVWNDAEGRVDYPGEVMQNKDGSFSYIDPKTGDYLTFKSKEEAQGFMRMENDIQTLSQSLPSRWPTAKGTTPSINDPMLADLATLMLDPAQFQQAVGALRQDPGMRVPGRKPEVQAEQMISKMVDNLLWLFDQVPPEIRERAKLWYDGAQQIAEKWADKYHKTRMQTAGILATLSPQKDWFMNVTMAERVLDILSTKMDHKFDDRMRASAFQFLIKDQQKSIEDRENTRAFENVQNKTLREVINGKDLREIGVWLRAYDEAHHDAKHAVIHPEGDFGENAITEKGTDTLRAWGGFDALGKAASIFMDGSPENINAMLGGEHKVRNFYNNIFNPSDPRFTTIDTHAVAAAQLRPLAGSDKAVADNFGKTGGTNQTGVSGTYPIYYEAYRRAAEARGILPREMQSITWEAIRGLFSSGFKGKKENLKAVDDIWKKVDSGKMTREEALAKINDMAGGIDHPDWWGGKEEKFILPRDTSYVHERPQFEGRQMMFEVAPDPNNVELTERWNALPPEAKLAITRSVSWDITAKALAHFYSKNQDTMKGELHLQTGGYLDNTNPSLSLWMNKYASMANIQRLARMLGHALNQDTTTIISPVKFKGGEEHGVIGIKGVTPDGAKALYNELRAAIKDENGNQLITGHTTGDGGMAILTPIGSRETIAKAVSDYLGDRHEVFMDKTYVQWMKKGDDGYGLSGRTEAGAGDAESSLRGAANRLREEATARIEGSIASAEGAARKLAAEGPGRRVALPPGGPAEALFQSVIGTHYSSQLRNTLLGGFYGTGARGAERERVMNSPDTRLRSRIHFYVDEGKGTFPEQGVGSIKHVVELNNLYDIREDSLGIRKKFGNDPSAMESAILDAGYDGFYAPEFMTRQGVAVVMGDAAKEMRPMKELNQNWYSPLADAISNHKMDSMPAEQWKAWLDKSSSQFGVKKDEIVLSGVKEWLDLQQDKVSKQQIADYLERGGVKVTEKLLEEKEPSWFVKTDGGSVVEKGFETREEAQAWADENEPYHGRYRVLQNDEPRGDAKYGDYVLPGAKPNSYKELFLTMPTEVPTRGEIAKRLFPEVRWDDLTNEQRFKIEDELKKADEGWRDGHLVYDDIQNPIVRIRMNERIDADGRRILFVEEVQQPSKTQPMPELLRKPEVGYAMAMKRLIKYAADNGYDGIAWTTGEQQAVRYDLSKQIDRVEYSGPTADGAYHVIAVPVGGGRDLMGGHYTLRGIEDYLGKDVAQRIKNGEGEDHDISSEYKVLSGDGLKVGGEGLSRLYDELIPRVARSVMKQLGGGDVTETKVLTTKMEKEINQYGEDIGLIKVKRDGLGRWFVFTDVYTANQGDVRFYWDGNKYTKDEGEARLFATKEEADASNAGTKQRAIILSDAMKAKVRGGMPLFQESRGGYRPATGEIMFGKNSDPSTSIHEGWHFFVDVYTKIANDLNCPPDIKADVAKMFDFVGVSGMEEWSLLQNATPGTAAYNKWVAAHEKMARAGEAYIMSGEFPVTGLRSIFNKFKLWIVEVYKTMSALNVEINPEIRGVFDRMIGKDTETRLPEAYKHIEVMEKGRDIIPGFAAEQVAIQPYPDMIPEPKTPYQINTFRINSQSDYEAALLRIQEVYPKTIEGPKSWKQADYESAQMLGEALYDGNPHDVQALMQKLGSDGPIDQVFRAKMMLLNAMVKDQGNIRDSILAKWDMGLNVSHEEQIAYLTAIERTHMAFSEVIEGRAAIGRALNQMKQFGQYYDVKDFVTDVLHQSAKEKAEAKAVAQLEELLVDYRQRFGAEITVEAIARMDKSNATLKEQRLFLKGAMEATSFEKFLEVWKAWGLLSGPWTTVVNIVGTMQFMALRPMVDLLAAGVGHLRPEAQGERLMARDAFIRYTAMLEAFSGGAKLYAEAIRTEAPNGKVDLYKQAIPGKLGTIARFPFRFLSDVWTKHMYRAGELQVLATHEALREGHQIGTPEMGRRVAEIMQNAPAEIMEKADAAADRMAFADPNGDVAKALTGFATKVPIVNILIPFKRTPLNIADELVRMSPFAPLSKAWREDIRTPGIAADRAKAEMLLGTLAFGTIFLWAASGNVTGAGPADPNKRRVWAGTHQPYSIKINGTWYSYARMQPIGTLFGMAADMAEIYDNISKQDGDKAAKMISAAFANAITNQTFLKGIADFVNCLSDPDRYGAKYAQSLIASAVPSLMAQTAAGADPYAREVYTVIDAVKNRIWGLRQTLQPKIDWMGQPVASRENFLHMLPVAVRDENQDPVAQEAARLGVSATAAPKKLHLGRLTGKLGDVELSPEERTKFATESGELAHRILQNIVTSPTWKNMPENSPMLLAIKRQVFHNVLTRAHQYGATMALPPEKRMALLQDILTKARQEQPQ